MISGAGRAAASAGIKKHEHDARRKSQHVAARVRGHGRLGEHVLADQHFVKFVGRFA